MNEPCERTSNCFTSFWETKPKENGDQRIFHAAMQCMSVCFYYIREALNQLQGHVNLVGFNIVTVRTLEP